MLPSVCVQSVIQNYKDSILFDYTCQIRRGFRKRLWVLEQPLLSKLPIK